MDRSVTCLDATRRTLLFGALSLALPARAARDLVAVGAPFSRVYERVGGAFTGMGAEILRAVGAQMGQRINFEMYPWVRAQSMVAQGQADILVGPYKTAERMDMLTFSERPFFQDEMVFYSRIGETFDWDGSFAALRGKRIVVINGWVFGDEFDRARKDLLIYVTNSVEAALTMLVVGRVDLFATNRRDTEPAMYALDMVNNLVPLERVISVQPAYFGFPRRPEHDKIRLRFDRALNNFAETGGLRKLGRRFSLPVP